MPDQKKERPRYILVQTLGSGRLTVEELLPEDGFYICMMDGTRIRSPNQFYIDHAMSTMAQRDSREGFLAL